MLEIAMEFRKGILFIRLSGSLNKETINKLNKEVTDLIKDNGIRNVLFNVSNLIDIDLKGIHALYYNYELCNYNNGISLICGNDYIIDQIKKSHLLKYMNKVSDEISAFNLI